MSTARRRGLAAGGTVVAAALANVATGMLTQNWTAAWWAFTGVVVLVGGALQAWLTIATGSESSRTQQVDRTTVGGNVRQRLDGPGEQTVSGSQISGDLNQEQNG
ncbi:hypothetical protein BZB76_6006 [Actinomadura pelletieri DSM 43383]|uniref:Uncharacterized protein n=1 Tax=Actinomadura pelletieri DSM 43383 TaxID=1120940 RepID=A0A495QAZ9_9ACTN|nr:hypothetical protein [Actinomadura pelletieri]RKS68869.1 hypothetical protein BZB76_6006 [Actinomadura pelletieri DSM 43383]